MGSVQERRPFRDADSTASSSGKAKVPRKPPRRAKNKGVLAGLRKCLPGSLLSLTLIFLLSFILIAFLFRKDRLLPGKPSAITPLPVPKVTELPMFQGSYREDMFWGTYRPNLYLGIRSRTPKSLLAGLMWLGINNGVYSLRHTCEDADNLNRYGWLRHDGISYGRQAWMNGRMRLPDAFEASPNVAVFQLIKKIPFEVDLVFVSGVNAEHPEIKKRMDNLAGVELSRKMSEKESAF